MSTYRCLSRPTIFAHRGSSFYAPENTIAAFKLAVAQNADAIELDAKCSADGEVIAFHDQVLERTTDGVGKVSDLPLEALKDFDAGGWFNPHFKGETIPTLNEVFEAVGKEIFINIELTNYATPWDDLPDKVVDLVLHYGIQNSVMFSSFNPRALGRTRKIFPDIPLGLLALPGIRGFWMRSWLGNCVPHEALHPEAGDITPKLVQKQHKMNHRVHVWTVNELIMMRHLFDLKVDGIFTDDPPLAQKILERSQK